MPGVYRFNSTNSNATGSNVTGLNYATGGYTVAFWIKGTRDFNGGDIFRQASTANALRDGYAIIFGTSLLTARHYTASTATTYTLLGGATHLDQTWKHYTVTYDGATLRTFVNGILRATGAAPNVPTANAACTTTLQPALSVSFSGNMFDLQIMTGAFVPPHEVQKMMDPTYRHPMVKGRYFGREFVGVGAGATLRDESGNGNNLTTPATTGRLDIAEEPPIRPTFA